MRWPRVRFTVRRMMVLVALAALVMTVLQVILLIRRDAEQKAADTRSVIRSLSGPSDGPL